MRNLFPAAVAVAAILASAPAGSTDAPANAYCYIGWPSDGAVLPAGKRSRHGTERILFRTERSGSRLPGMDGNGVEQAGRVPAA